MSRFAYVCLEESCRSCHGEPEPSKSRFRWRWRLTTRTSLGWVWPKLDRNEPNCAVFFSASRTFHFDPPHLLLGDPDFAWAASNLYLQIDECWRQLHLYQLAIRPDNNPM